MKKLMLMTAALLFVVGAAASQTKDSVKVIQPVKKYRRQNCPETPKTDDRWGWYPFYVGQPKKCNRLLG